MNLLEMIKRTHLLRPNSIPLSHNLAIVCVAEHIVQIPEMLLSKAQCIFVLQHSPDQPTAITISSAGSAPRTIPLHPFGELADQIRFDILFFHPDFSTRWLGASSQYLYRFGVESYHVSMPTPYNQGISTTHIPGYYSTNKEDLELLFQRLADGESKRVFASRIRALETGNIGYIKRSAYPQYFHPLVQPGPGDTIIDGGVSEDLHHSLQFLKSVGQSGKIFGFEPDPIGFTKAQETLVATQGNENYRLIPLGLWNKRDTLHFDLAGDGTHVSHKKSQGSCPCEVISIDEFAASLSLKKVDLIKLDVEGAEMNVLKGALRTISQFKPKMAISLYHTPSDLYSIPRFLHEIDPGYSIYIGHHHACLFETVLYAIKN